MMKLNLSQSVLSVLFAPCLLIGCAPAAPPSSSASENDTSILAAQLEKIAEIRASDARSAAKLSDEGGLLYALDQEKLSGPDYCALSLRLARAGEFRLAIRAASKALYLGERSGDNYVTGLGHRDLAYAYSLAGDFDKAIYHAEQTLSLSRRVSRNRSVDLSFLALSTLASVHARKGELDRAIDHYRRALEVADRLPGKVRGRLSSQTYLALANAELDRGDIALAKLAMAKLDKEALGAATPHFLRLEAKVADAEGRFEEAISKYEASAQISKEDQAYFRMMALAGVASTLRTQGRLDDAMEKSLAALDEAESIRARFRSEEISSGAFGDAQDIFDDAVELAFDTGRPKLALEISERSRSRAALDLLKGRVAGKGLDATVAGSRKSAFAVSTEASAVANMTNVSSRMPKDSVVIVYHLTDTDAYSWAIRRSGVTHAKIDLGSDTLVRTGFAMRRLASKGDDLKDESFITFRNALLGGLNVQKNERLIFVPHGELHYVPFQALWSGKRYLIQTNPVSYAPSVSVLLTLLDKGLSGDNQTVLAYGNPYAAKKLPALPAAEAEAKEIASVFPQAIIRSGPAATEEAFKNDAAAVGTIHIAAHAKLDALDPLYSTIFLAASPSQDGFLEAHEVYDLNLSGSGMVTLSACETGLGKVGAGDEQWGFVRTFLAAGARSAIVSNWDVADEATRRLMTAFYSALKEGDPRHVAMRKAQLSLMEASETTLPVYWASFNIWGDPDGRARAL